MKNSYKSIFTILCALVICLFLGTSVFAQSVGGASVQTNSATNTSNSQATLNGYLSVPYLGGSNYVYFQWGTTTGYGNQTAQQYISSGTFSQIISGLGYNSAYHFRAVAQGSFGTIYGQDMTFYTVEQNNNGNVTVNAGPSLYLTSGQTGTLQGSANDSGNYPLNYSWSCTGGTLSSYNAVQPIYTAPFSNFYSGQTTYTCTLMATDSYGNSNSGSTTVYINSNNGNNGSNYAQTNYATYVSANQATLNGQLLSNNNYNNYNFNNGNSFVYFQWGTDTNYGNTTPEQQLNYAGSFIQVITGLSYNTTYHFRAVAQGNYGTLYGQDLTFNTSYGTNNTNYNNNYYGSGTLSISKQVIDLSSGNLNWQTSVNANPSDILSFSITLQANGQDVHNVLLRDILPSYLMYKGDLTVNTNTNFGGDITAGINIGTVYANQPVVVAYQVQAEPASSFVYGTTTISNNATVTSTESGAQTASATVVVSRTQVYGASTVSTGLTNNFFTDSFFLPLLTIVIGLWLIISGKAIKFIDWIKSKK